MQYGFTTKIKNNILNSIFSNNDIFEEKPLYVGLLVNEGQPDEVPVELSISEVSGYSRAPITFSNAYNGIIENNSQVLFPTAKTDWTVNNEKIFAIGIFDSAEGDFVDSCLVYLPLSEQESILIGETFSLNPNSIKLQLA